MIDTTRHQVLFDPANFKFNINIIGLGAVGSKLFVELVKLGIAPEQFFLHDDDIVESHNIANQLFFDQHIGMSKVEASTSHFPEYDGRWGLVSNQRIEASSTAQTTRVLKQGITFMCVDSMKARKHLFYDHIKNKVGMGQVFEARMGIEYGMVNSFDPSLPHQVANWESSLCEDSDVPEIVTPCGGTISVGFNTSITAAHMVSMFLIWNILENEQRSNDWILDETRWKDAVMTNQIIFSNIHPYGTESFTW